MNGKVIFRLWRVVEARLGTLSLGETTEFWQKLGMRGRHVLEVVMLGVCRVSLDLVVGLGGAPEESR